MAATVNPNAKFPNLETVVARRLWPTPKGSAANYGQPRENDRGDLQAEVMRRHWPTPRAADGLIHGTIQASQGRIDAGKRYRGTLEEFVALWPTPTANRWDGLQSHGVNAITGQLNPTWVEWLQGYPLGWTEL